MSEKPIQRWYGLLRELTGTGRSYITRAVVVTYADHVAAVAAAEQRGYKRGEQDQIDMTRDWGLHQHEVGRLQGQRDALDKALEALNEMPELGGGLAPFVRRHAALQVIYALKENSDE